MYPYNILNTIHEWELQSGQKYIAVNIYIWLRYYQGRYDSSYDIRSDECCVYNDKSTS